MRIPLRIKTKIPKVNIVIGRVRIVRTGLIKVLITPKTIATIIAVTNPSILTPGKTYAAAKTAMLDIRRCPKRLTTG